LAGKLARDCLARGLGQSEAPGTGAPVDLAYLARFTLGNVALEREVLQLFAAQMPLYLDALRKARVRKAWREAAHSIKGSAWAVGAWRLAGCAQFAERVEMDGELAPQAERENAVVGVARAAEEACRFIGRRLAGS
jgi:HPt (histidine-containing phosphotransfer) domain-containing protein